MKGKRGVKRKIQEGNQHCEGERGIEPRGGDGNRRDTEKEEDIEGKMRKTRVEEKREKAMGLRQTDRNALRALNYHALRLKT